MRTGSPTETKSSFLSWFTWGAMPTLVGLVQETVKSFFSAQPLSEAPHAEMPQPDYSYWNMTKEGVITAWNVWNWLPGVVQGAVLVYAVQRLWSRHKNHEGDGRVVNHFYVGGGGKADGETFGREAAKGFFAQADEELTKRRKLLAIES